jgi:Predicted glycosyltransferases
MFNNECGKSKTCKALANLNESDYNIKITVVDNSTIITENNDFCTLHGWNYIKMNGNEGISKAYNRALDSIDNLNCWIVIFDQDTEISEDYFNKAIKSIKENSKSLIHVPIVKDDVGILSPCYMKRYAVKRFKSVKEILIFPNYISTINTGMIINGKIFDDKLRYNEGLFLDYVDHDFIKNFRETSGNIKIFDCILFQNFSDNDHKNINSDIKRFKIYFRDFKVFCSDSFIGRTYYLLKIIYRAVKLSYLYKNIIFIRMLFE